MKVPSLYARVPEMSAPTVGPEGVGALTGTDGEKDESPHPPINAATAAVAAAHSARGADRNPNHAETSRFIAVPSEGRARSRERFLAGRGRYEEPTGLTTPESLPERSASLHDSFGSSGGRAAAPAETSSSSTVGRSAGGTHS